MSASSLSRAFYMMAILLIRLRLNTLQLAAGSFII